MDANVIQVKEAVTHAQDAVYHAQSHNGPQELQHAHVLLANAQALVHECMVG
ncbi:hypothetical protein [Sutcliffiella deserti]|uniref:hypothetical protein n=1 Tax=Sutcliffiella deserti TaxID=2875501 RepID=UPI001CBE65FC|nr:hypothetical protein [Sutcliffiella deserti]